MIYKQGIHDYMKDNQTTIKISHLNKNLPELSQLIGFFDSNTLTTDELTNLIKGSSNDKACLLLDLALENNWLFQILLQDKFKKTPFKVHGGMKTNT